MSKEHEKDKREEEKEKKEMEVGDAGWDEFLGEQNKTQKKSHIIGW